MTDDQHGDQYGDQYGDRHGDQYDGRHDGRSGDQYGDPRGDAYRDQYDDQYGDRHGGGAPPSGGRWDPLPQGDYDDGATAFVKLPEGGVDALLAAHDSPLAAPGHGYVPPQITVAPTSTAGTDPAATGSWATPSAPVDGTQWQAQAQAPDAGQDPAAREDHAGYPQHDPYGGAAPYDANAGYGAPGQDDPYPYRPGATGHWDFSGAVPGAAAAEGAAGPDALGQDATGQDVTGQWSIPVADGDLPDESGEYTASALAEQWGGGAPATLPGGAPAPWATQSAGRPWGEAASPAAPDAGERPPEISSVPATRPGPGPAGRPWGEDAPQTGPEPDERHARAPHTPEPHGLTAATTAHGEAEPVTASTVGPAAAEEAPDGPTEASAGTAEEPGAEPAPEAAEDPATASAAAPEPTAGPDQDREPAPDRGPAVGEPDHAPALGEEARPAPEPRPEQAPVVQAPTPGAEQTPAAQPPTPEAETEAGADDVEATGTDAPDEPRPDEPASDGVPGPRPDSAPGQASAGPQEEHPLASYVLRVNGADRPVTDAWIGESLLYVLRERLGLAGAKDGCSQGECGACNVQVDGRLVASCLVPAVTSAGSEVRTVEGLAADGQPSDVQRALARRGAVQCGFCVPGMAMTVHNLLEGNPAPTDLEARQALCGNLCRCSGYRGVLEAVQEVVAEREAHTAAEEQPGTDSEEPRIPHQAGPGAGGVNASAFEPQPRPGNPDPARPHDHSHGDRDDRGDHGDHGQDGGHA
ncbi:2Fe-2S iron-sulfur cluster-binding protein [Streptomyces sp. NPDC057245]|uniref:2Fe-2S iron-sulfur cluster-binding protein n=1 Tax=Streptomyces sp. NPDC057245 TaxID=3346065 RepID=UPI00363D9122